MNKNHLIVFIGLMILLPTATFGQEKPDYSKPRVRIPYLVELLILQKYSDETIGSKFDIIDNIRGIFAFETVIPAKFPPGPGWGTSLFFSAIRYQRNSNYSFYPREFNVLPGHDVQISKFLFVSQVFVHAHYIDRNEEAEFGIGAGFVRVDSDFKFQKGRNSFTNSFSVPAINIFSKVHFLGKLNILYGYTHGENEDFRVQNFFINYDIEL